MKIQRISSLALVLGFIFLCSSTCGEGHNHFLECLSQISHNYSSISNIVYTPRDSSYISILQFSIKNLRFMSESTSKPQVIITPQLESQIPPIIHCAKKTNLEIRTRSGGHDFEGLSYVAQVPFLVIDLINLGEITVDAVEKTAWVQAGATIGALYYKIAEKSPVLGFPAGSCLTLGVGGHFSGGGYGTLLRKHGLAADQVVDARIIDVRGRLLDRKSMGEDLFWAIRGGGGASFGVILAWKVRLVDVPEKLTVFRIQRSLEQNATQLVHRWQYVAPRLDRDLFIGVLVGPAQNERKKTTIRANFFSVFLGGMDRLLGLMQESFPELGLVREDCAEMSWIQSTLYIAGFPIESRQVLLNRSDLRLRNFKSKSDYVQKPIPEFGLEGIWRQMFEPEAAAALVLLSPYGGRMAEISESALPFPHRGGNLFEIAPVVYWNEDEGRDSDRYISWIRRLESYLTPYVSTSPRAAYLNYRDLDLGVNDNEGKTSYARARIWGVRYFNNNFDRLVQVKTLVDPNNFFRNEQSIPPLHYSRKSENGD
ncbi:tetrahydroberberine oxidase-like [Salvia miltiorrhiza]|uniref:tetrahydroberberine oxidase-like n=1 Tax=Salvia miltiorrhiza TaxID=226208 RepID=UPI0025ACCABA|nr:tetrahydroberberine oxidase-like [Salvia miltiorrhiza]